MKGPVVPVVCLLAGAALGFAVARYVLPTAEPVATEGVPSEWVARVGDRYVTPGMLQEEMRRRGGLQPGQFQDVAQKRALLDDMLLQQALVQAAHDARLDQDPETRRSIEQLLTSQYLKGTLRQTQNAVHVPDDAVQAYYDEHAQDYATPPRRRIAMLRIGVPKDASAEAWAAAEKRAAEALERARALGASTVHFGAVAREYSDDQASRYRGGVIGWLTEGRSADYKHDPALLDAAFALAKDGDFSPVLRGEDAVYVARLVETQDARTREFSQLRAGIQQRLTQDRYADIERKFRDGLLSAADIEIDTDALAAVTPPGPPAADPTPTPPAMPATQGAAP